MRKGFGRGALAAALAAVAALGTACGSRSSTGSDAPGTQQAPPLGTGPGPWAVENRTFGATDGIQESPAVGLTTDEAQNRWLATQQALYLMRPGESAFRRYDARDGLHLAANPQRYCNDRPVSATDRCGGVESFGAAEPPGITAIVGGGPNEVFVGYGGAATPNLQCTPKDPTVSPIGYEGDYCDPLHNSGMIDRVRLAPGGALQVDRFDMFSGNHGLEYWHDRTVDRLAFDHFVHAHTLYAGTNHGVDLFFPDEFRNPGPGEAVNTVAITWMGDHLHARVCFEKPCVDDSNQRMGDWRGLAIDANGDLWHAGKWTAGLIAWDSDPAHWFSRGGAAFKAAFGDPYYGPGNGNPPVFEVANEGHVVALSAVAVCPDGKVWFGSSGVSDGVTATVASWDGKRFTAYDAASLGAAESAVADLACLPDGRLAIAGPSSGVVLVDPAAPQGAKRLRAGAGLPDDHVTSLDVDRMVKPFTLHVATAGGAAALRVLP